MELNTKQNEKPQIRGIELSLVSFFQIIYSGILRQKKKSGQHAVKGKECDHSSIKLNTTLYTHTTTGIFFRQVFYLGVDFTCTL